jgi:hypothetical protein
MLKITFLISPLLKLQDFSSTIKADMRVFPILFTRWPKSVRRIFSADGKRGFCSTLSITKSGRMPLQNLRTRNQSVFSPHFLILTNINSVNFDSWQRSAVTTYSNCNNFVIYVRCIRCQIVALNLPSGAASHRDFNSRTTGHTDINIYL